MCQLFDLTEHGVRIFFVSTLSEGWIYITPSRLLLIDESLAPEDQDDAARRVLLTLHRSD